MELISMTAIWMYRKAKHIYNHILMWSTLIKCKIYKK